MAQKWIINEGRFKMANVAYHKDIARDHSTTKGGGFWNRDDENKTLYLWGVSSDFGYSDPEVVKEAIENDLRLQLHLGEYKVMKSPIISPTMPSIESFTELCTIKF